MDLLLEMIDVDSAPETAAADTYVLDYICNFKELKI